MSKKSLDGEQKRFEFRPGMLNLPGFKGINKQVEPSNIPPFQFQHLENVRLVGGQVKCRGGQTKLSATASTGGCIWGIFPSEYQFTGVGASFIFPTGNPDSAVENLISAGIINIDPAANPVGALFIMDEAATYDLINVVTFGTRVFFLSVEEDGHYTLRRYRGLHVTPNIALELGALVINHFAVLGNTMYLVGTETDELLDTKTYTWDGSASSVTLDNDFAEELAFPKLGIRTASSDVLMVGGSDSGDANARVFINNAGVWAETAVPGTLTNFSAFTFIEYGTTTYISGTANGVNRVVTWDGAALALEKTLVFSDPAPFEGNSLAVFDGDLFWSLTGGDEFGNDIAWIAKFDGAVWTDTEKDLNAQYGDDVSAVRLFSTAANLYLIVDIDPAGTRVTKVIKSPGLVVSGTWTEVMTDIDHTGSIFTFGQTIFPIVDVTGIVIEYA